MHLPALKRKVRLCAVQLINIILILFGFDEHALLFILLPASGSALLHGMFLRTPAQQRQPRLGAHVIQASFMPIESCPSGVDSQDW